MIHCRATYVCYGDTDMPFSRYYIRSYIRKYTQGHNFLLYYKVFSTLAAKG